MGGENGLSVQVVVDFSVVRDGKGLVVFGRPYATPLGWAGLIPCLVDW